MKHAFCLLALLSVTVSSQAALNFTGIGDTVVPTQVDLNAGIGGSQASTLTSAADGALSFGDAPGVNPSSAFTNLTLSNTGSEQIGTWLVSLNSADQHTTFPGVFSDVILTVSTGTSSFQVPGTDGTYSFGLVNVVAPAASDTLTFSFASSNPAAGPINYAFSATAISITAVVPEPSSALLLTSLLGIFGSAFRRRRSLPISE